MKVGFQTVVSYLPKETLRVEDHYAYLDPARARLPEIVQERLRRSVPGRVRRLKDASAAEAMSVAVGLKALETSGLDASEIDCLLVTQTGGRQFMPLLGSYVHLNLGLSRNVIVRNIVDSNTSAVDASNIAWSFVRTGLCRRVLVIAVAAQIGGQVAFGVDLTDPFCQRYGDGAAAAIVSAEHLQCEFLAYHFETHAVGSRTGGTLIADFGDVRPLSNRDLAAKAGVEDKEGAYLTLDDPSFDAVAGRRGFIAETLGRAVQKAGVSLRDLDLIVTPHIGHLEPIWREDLQAVGVNPEICRNLRAEYGDTAVADLLIDLAEFSQEGAMANDSLVALWAPCSGVQLATLVLRWL